MIVCRVDFSNVSQSFVSFQAKSIMHLATKLDEVSQKIQLLDTGKAQEIDVFIELKGIRSISSADSNALCNFVSAKTDIPFRLQLQHDDCLSKEMVDILQKRLDIAFWKANATWHQKKLSFNFSVPLQHLLSALYPFGLPAPSLMIQENQAQPMQQSPAKSDVFPMMKAPLPPLAINESKVIDCRKISLDGQTSLQKYQARVLDLLPSELIANILACVGLMGLTHFCEKLCVFDREDLQKLMTIFFSGQRLLDMLALLTPRGMNTFKICEAWPQNLVKHWVHWLEQHSGDRLGFFHAVSLMDYFWQKIKHRHPEIGTEKSHGRYPLDKRISEMLAFLEAMPEVSRKIQISFLFALDWDEARNLKTYSDILEKNHLVFVSKPMLAQPMQQMPAHLPLAAANLASCMLYIGQHLHDKSRSAMDTIGVYLQNIHDETGYQLAAWCACVSTCISADLFQELYQLLSLMPQAQQIDLIKDLYAIELEKRLLTSDLQVLVTIADGNHANFFALIKICRIWFGTNQEDFKRSWTILTDYLSQDTRESTLDVLFSQARQWQASKTLANDCYFQALIACLGGDEDRKNPALLTNSYTAFSTLSKIKQAEILSVISSYDFSDQQPLDLNALANLLNENTAENGLEDLFNRYFPNSVFNYYKSSIDYQLVFSSIEELIHSVQESIDFFLSDETIFGFLKIQSLLMSEVLSKLKAQKNVLSELLSDLTHLKMQKNNIDLSNLFTHLKEFEIFFTDFLNWKLGSVFGEKSYLLYGVGGFGALIHGLDETLNAGSSLSDLMYKVLEKHETLKKTPIGYHFQFEILQIMISQSQMPLLQRYLDYRLVQKIIKKLNEDILRDLSASIIPKDKLEQLSKFIHQLPLDQAGVNAFFQRYLGVKQVLKTWPALELRLINIEQDPVAFWDLLVKHQLPNGKANCVAHWQIGISLMNHLLDWQTSGLIASNFSTLTLFDAFFTAHQGLKAIELYSIGEIKHEHWQQLLVALKHSIPAFGNHPAFFNTLPKAVEHILSNGTPFNFEKNLEVFAGFSQNPQLIPRLLELMNHPDRQIQQQVGKIFLAIGDLLSKQDRRPWQKFMVKLLNFSDFEAHIAEIEDLLLWIKHESNFYGWLELVVYDEKASLSELLMLKNLLGNPDSLWMKAYMKLFKHSALGTSTEPPSPKVNAKLGLWRRVYNYFMGVQIPAIEVPKAPTASAAEAITKQAWLLWSKAPYPDLKRLLSWLQSTPEDIVLELQEFDRFPLGPLSPYQDSKKDITRWMSELEFYEFCPPSKTNLAERLATILEDINQFLVLSRMQIIENFHQLRQQMDVKNLSQQNQLIALIATIYYKSTNRKPYPTQLLTILLSLEYQNHNLLFEVDTGEGKGITTALLAVLKWALREKATIEVRTANRDLVKQDFYEKGHWQFFKLLDIEHAVIEQDSPPEIYRQGGIYYTTQDDVMVFQEQRRRAGYHTPFKVDILADEVDSLLLDQKSLINLGHANPEMSDHAWIYFAINRFIDACEKSHPMPKASILKPMAQISSSSQVSSKETIQPSLSMAKLDTKQLIEQYATELKKVLVNQNTHVVFRLIQIEKITVTQWQDWLVTALYAKTLLENKDYLVEEIEIDGQKMHQAVPYINGEVKYGFELSFQMKPGLTQFLHARLESPSRRFIMAPENQVVSQLPAIDFRGINSFIGLSGSIGCLSELFDMVESTCAKAVRIPRFYPAKLQELPNILVENMSALSHAMAEMAGAAENPTLIVTEKIQDAHAIYKSLSRRFPKRPIRLLTGQESEIERRNWLHASEGHHYAGSKNSITVATQICGRGTDIVVQKPYYLEVKQVGILGPRNGVQIKGRTARVNTSGRYQVVYCREMLLRDWVHLSAQLPPLDISTLSFWIEKIQDQLMQQTRHRRLHLRLKGWCQKHLLNNLEFCLEHTHLDASQKQSYYLFISQALDELSNLIPQRSLNIEEYTKGSALIWKKVLVKFEMAGFEHPYCTQAIFYNSLVADTDAALRLVTQVLIPHNERQMAINQQNLFSESDLIALRNALLQVVPKVNLQSHEQVIPWYSFIRRLFAWLFDAGDLVKHTSWCLNKSWQLFQQMPSLENWEDFYQHLLAAVKLYETHQQASIWRLSYWFPSLHPISPWLEAYKQLNAHLNKQLISGMQNLQSLQTLKVSLSKKFLETPKVASLWQNILKLWYNMMGYFNQDIKNALHSLHQVTEAFIAHPQKSQLQNLVNQVNQAKILFTQASQWNSLRLGYWLYWHKQCQVWLDLADELDKLLKNADLKSSSLKEWKVHQEQISNFKLGYRAGLIQQAEDMTYLSQYSFWRSNIQSEVIPQQGRLVQPNLGGQESIKQQIHELAKLYPTQTEELYHLFYPHETDADVQNPKQAYAMILSIIHAYAHPAQSQSVQLHLSAKPMSVLLVELQKLSKRRELLNEWEAHKTSLEMGI